MTEILKYDGEYTAGFPKGKFWHLYKKIAKNHL